MARVQALVTPSVMRWAREQARLSLDEASSKIKRSPEEIAAWEEGTLRPSIAQARKACEVYRRPLAVFYLPDPPKDFETLRDYRSLADTEVREFSPELAFLIRIAHHRQDWMRDYLLSEGFEPLTFVGAASTEDIPQDIPQDIRKVIQVSPKEQRECETRYEALRLWIERSEAAGVFIFRQRQISLIEARGFLISDDIAPFIFINSEDSKSAQLFTLAHELAHLWLNLSGISNLETRGRAIDEETRRIEVFCNKVAAYTVLDDQVFNDEWEGLSPSTPLEERIHHVSGALKVSEEVVARRLLEKNEISQETYRNLGHFYQDRWEEVKARERYRMKSSKGGPSYYVTTAAKVGYAFTQTVVSAFMSGAISGRDASSLLNVKVNNLRRLGKVAGIPSVNREGYRG